ncbi:MAG: hypothetical protein AABY18_07635 [Candidatus Thermoplasmatota archaeon]
MRLLTAALLLACMAAAASAHPESAAPSLHPAVLRTWHEPEPVEPGTQWSGFLQLRPDHGFTNVSYQVCDVADGVCFSFPHPAQDAGNGTYRFDTKDYLANGRPVEWQAGWRVGVRWFLGDGSGNGTWVPRSPAEPTEVVPIEDLYLTFTIPGGEEHGAPGPALASLAVALLGASALAARARRGRT